MSTPIRPRPPVGSDAPPGRQPGGKPRRPRLRVGRAGYSLMEMLIVMLTLASLAGLAWPTLRHALGKSQLREAAKTVRTEMAKARLTAIETGVPQQFSYQPGTGRFVVSPAGLAPGGEPEAPDATAPPSSDFARHSEPPASAGPHECMVHCLADGVQFCDPLELASQTIDSETADSEMFPPENVADGAETWSVPIVFYPSGRALDAVVRLSGERDFRVAVSLKGLSGVIEIEAPHRAETVTR